MRSNHSSDVTYYSLALLFERNLLPTQDLINVDDKYYGIHGLWPQISPTSFPQNCCEDCVFDEGAIQPIITDLHTYWHSNSRKDILFWEHEWSKHGTCTNPLLSEIMYFSKTIQLYREIKEKYDAQMLDLEKYAHPKGYRLPFDLNFKLLTKPVQ